MYRKKVPFFDTLFRYTQRGGERNAEGKKLFNNTLLTIKLFIMNKRFFTLMAAVMLAGSPFAATEAFASTYAVSYASNTAALANGMKFFLGTSGTTLLKVT